MSAALGRVARSIVRHHLQLMNARRQAARVQVVDQTVAQLLGPEGPIEQQTQRRDGIIVLGLGVDLEPRIRENHRAAEGQR